MLRVKLLSFLFIALNSGLLSGQAIPIKTLGVKDGLPQASITCLLHDRDGFIWAGTKDGLTRYNGYEFEVLRYVQGDSTSLSSSNITALAQDIAGNIWVGTSFGLNKLDPKTFRSTRYYHWFMDDYSLSSNRVTSLICDQFGVLYIGTDNGLNKLLGKSGRFEIKSIRDQDPASLSSNKVNTLYIDRNNNLWVGTDVGLNMLMSDGQFKRYKKKFSDFNSLSDNSVLSIAEDYEGFLWIGTSNGLNRFHPSLEIFTHYFENKPKPGLIKSNVINALTVDIEGRIWVGTSSGLSQLYRNLRSNDDSVNDLYDFMDIPDGFITCLMADRSGLIWVGTMSAGVSLLNDDSQRFFSSHGSPSSVTNPALNKANCFLRLTESTLLVGTAMGVKKYRLSQNDANRRSYWENDGVFYPLDVAVRDMRMCSDSLVWLATEGQGLLAIDPTLGKQVKSFVVNPQQSDGIPSNRLTSLDQNDPGKLWIGTLGGGFCSFNLSTESFKTYRYAGDEATKLRDNNVWSIKVQDARNIWIGTGNAGLYHFDEVNAILTEFMTGEAGSGHMVSGIINSLHLDRLNNLWIATSGAGLSMLAPNSNKFENFTVSDGLASNVVLAICTDFEDNVWMSTNGGISVLDVSSRTFRNYNELDIPGYNTFYQGSAYLDNQSRIYFGGANGFNYFYAEGLRDNKFIPPVAISRFNLLSEQNTVVNQDRLINVADTIYLDHDHPGFTIEFAALNFKQIEKNQYAYRMKGLFDQWRYLGNRRFATFSNLNPGIYTFEVKGSNNDGYWNENPARISVVITPAFWQTTSFRLFVVLSFFSALYALYLYRIRSEKSRRLELEKAVDLRTQEIAKERDTNAVLLKEVHHRVKNNLQIIVSLLNLQSRFITDRNLISIFDQVQNRVRSMSLIHQKMYQSKDLSTVNIAEYIKDLSKNLLETYKVGQQVKLEMNIEVNRFNSDTLTPLGLIINEIISNALKYAFTDGITGVITVQITERDNGLYRMIIGDDGIGMSLEAEQKGGDSFGSELIEALTEQLNGSIMRLRDRKGTVYQVDFEDVEV